MIQHFNATTALGVHSALVGALHQQQAGRNMAGAKADIQWCFDSVDFGVAFLVFDHLGAPAGLTQALRFFYAGQTRWFISRGCVHPSPVQVQGGLLQGWPASPALLNAINGDLVSCYGPGPSTDWFWAQGRDAVSALVAAAEHAADTDVVAACILHQADRWVKHIQGSGKEGHQPCEQTALRISSPSLKPRDQRVFCWGWDNRRHRDGCGPSEGGGGHQPVTGSWLGRMGSAVFVS